jgi:hypothetical protein
MKLLNWLLSLDRECLMALSDDDTTSMEIVTFERGLKVDGLTAFQELREETQNLLIEDYYLCMMQERTDNLNPPDHVG